MFLVRRYVSNVPPRVANKFVGKPRGLVLGRGLEFFRFLYHFDDTVITPAAGRLFYRDNALPSSTTVPA